MDEDKQKLAEKLGFKSVDDLEAAIDELDGIAEDGGKLDTTITSKDTGTLGVHLLVQGIWTEN